MYQPRQRAAFSIPVKSVSFKSFDYRRHRACAIARLVELYTTYTTILRQIERCHGVGQGTINYDMGQKGCLQSAKVCFLYQRHHVSPPLIRITGCLYDINFTSLMELQRGNSVLFMYESYHARNHPCLIYDYSNL